MEFNDQNFQDEVIKSDQAVLVDFYAEWCGPCQIQGPIVEELAKEYAGKAKIGQLDVDANQATASAFQVMSIPTLILFKNGAPAERFVGLQQKNVLAEKINSLL